MILPITIQEMQRLNIACKRILGDAEWERRSDIAWGSLHSLDSRAFITADMLESAILDGLDITTGVNFDSEEAQKLRALAEYLMRGFVGPHTGTLKMILAKVPR
jgi:hypothetical protein